MLIAQTRPARPSRSGATSHASGICRGGSSSPRRMDASAPAARRTEQIKEAYHKLRSRQRLRGGPDSSPAVRVAGAEHSLFSFRQSLRSARKSWMSRRSAEGKAGNATARMHGVRLARSQNN